MYSFVRRLIAVIIVLAMMIPVVAISEEESLKATINKTAFTAGEDAVITWEATPGWGDQLQSYIWIYYEGNNYEDVFGGERMAYRQGL